MRQKPIWYFESVRRGQAHRDPITGEFFSTEAIRDSGEALVREGIQNSLDAVKSGQRVRVRIHVSGEQGAASPADLAPFLCGLHPHLEAPNNGILDDLRPDLRAPCRFLVFEDFGTEGLTGDTEQWHRKDGVRNGFFAFFRAEGENAKSDSDRRGRWGVGKFVFPRASTGNTFFGLTVRAGEGRPLLLGRSVLRSHQINGQPHVPDGFFGLVDQAPEGSLVLPVSDTDLIDRFTRTFRLERRQEPGLSIVVPWYDEAISLQGLLEATMRDWFFSVLSGDLSVVLSDHDSKYELTAASFDDHLDRLVPATKKELSPLVALARFASQVNDQDRIVIDSADVQGRPRWRPEMLSESTRSKLRTALERMAPVAVRVPILVRPKRMEEQPSELDIFVVKDEGADEGRPVFVREGIIVTDAKGKRARGYRAMVVASHKPLADLLGDAENPAHTEWRPDTANFKDRYFYGPGYLSFVKESVGELIALVDGSGEDTDPGLLVDHFSLPSEPASPGPSPKPGLPGGTTVPPVPPDPPRAPSYLVSRVDGGFSLTGRRDGSRPPDQVIVRLAYDVRRGDPFKKYDPADFDLSTDVRIDGEPRGMKVESAVGNRLVASITSEDFGITLTGFDVHRDLIIKVAAKGDLNDDPKAELD